MLIDDIIKKPESRRLEFKIELPQKDQITRTVLAFSNGAGGEIYLGIQNEPREIIGIQEDRLFKLEETIANIIADNCQPTIVPETGIFSVNDKYILRIKIYPGYNTPYYLKKIGKDSGTIIRIGSTNRVANADIIAELERRSRNLSFDSIPQPEFAGNFPDLSVFKKFYQTKTGKFIDDDQLTSLELVKKDRDDSLPVNAAFLLAEFNLRKKVFPFAQIECARFKGTNTKTFLDQQTINAPIILQPQQAMKFVMRNISQSSTIGTIYRKDRWEYPLEAVREAIINAVIHRDYSILGSDIKLAIFDDMLEITSPGTFLPSIDPDHLENNPSEIRNVVLAPIFKDCGLIEKWGSGFKKILKEMKDFPDLQFQINEPSNSVQIQFIKKDYSFNINAPETDHLSEQVSTKLALSKHQVKIMRECFNQARIVDLMKIIGRSDRTKFRNQFLKPLLKEKLLEMTIPDKPRSSIQKYRLTEKGKKLIKKIIHESKNI